MIFTFPYPNGQPLQRFHIISPLFTEILNRSLRADLIVCNSATNVTNNLFFVKAYGSPQCTMTVLIQLKIISQFSVLRNLAKEYKASLSPEIIKKLDEDSREVKKQIDNLIESLDYLI